MVNKVFIYLFNMKLLQEYTVTHDKFSTACRGGIVSLPPNLLVNATIPTVRVKKSSRPKTCCNIFIQAKYISVKFCQFVTNLYPLISTNSG